MRLQNVINRLIDQTKYYSSASRDVQINMEAAALYIAAHTIRVRLATANNRILKGEWPTLPCANEFHEARLYKHPVSWGKQDKACFARALCGYSLNEDAVCKDVWLRRFKVFPVNTIEQWKKWFSIYRYVYGKAMYEQALCIHINWLDIIWRDANV